MHWRISAQLLHACACTCVPGASASWLMQQFELGLNLSTKKTRKRELLEQMQHAVS